MRDKLITVVALSIIYICMFGSVPQFIYNHYSKPASIYDEVSVDWEGMYPFTEEVNQSGESERNNNLKSISCNVIALIHTYDGLVKRIENRIEDGVNRNFLCRLPIIEANGKILKIMGIRQISGSDPVVDMGDGYLTFIYAEADINEAAEEVNEFSAWLQTKDIRFLYVQAPFKVEEGTELSGYIDYSNINADNFLTSLDKTVDVIDLREEMQKEFNGYYKEQFFKTDHHWLPETGLWATQKIAEYLNVEYGCEIDAGIYDIENFEVEIYEDWMLGSLGKKVTLGYTEAEDLNIYYPNFENLLHVNVPSLEIDVTGDFYETLIDQRILQTKRYYDWGSYWAYGYGDRGLIEIDNLKIGQDKKILMIKDSFADTVFPFLALGVSEMDIIDLRHFTGSLRGYIEEMNPDIVIFLCNPSSLLDVDGKIERDSHTSCFDLR
ncbi:MAG: hypothetical protein NC417_13780 [Candidatus Gastranaerophilales bacterium]|nr:hypothetical protein [Candidatus Gastranaerophilales bacterium]